LATVTTICELLIMSVIVEKAQWRREAAGSLRRIHYGME